MSAPHFFLPSVEDDRLVVEGDDAKHAVRVLRITPGERITISDGNGRVADATVTAAGRTMEAGVTGRRDAPKPRPALIVYQGLPKHGKLERIVQSLTQCGVAEIYPMRAARSIAKWDEAKAAANVARLRAIAREAAMQSRRAYLPIVGDVTSGPPSGAIVLHEQAPMRLRDALPGEAPERVVLAIGPEGGFDDAEIAAWEASGCRAASLGPFVYRTEIAPVVGATVVQARYGIVG